MLATYEERNAILKVGQHQARVQTEAIQKLDCPVLAEGRYGSPAEARAALAAGAFAVVVGTAITDPLALTRRIARAVASARGTSGAAR